MLYEYLLFQQPLPCFGEKMSFEEKLDDACHRKELPGIVLAANGPGKFGYQKSFGKRSVKGQRGHEQFDVDAVFNLASCTKLITTVAALQCVERGLVTLDEDITGILPEFKNIEILVGFDDRTLAPVLIESQNKMTLRHLLSHTSGISHPSWNHLLYEYLSTQSCSIPPLSGITGKIERTLFYPLVFEPGTSWEYGAGLDWAGKVVERLNNGISLQEYVELHIFNPLNMISATFRLSERPELKDRVPKMMVRQGLNHPIYGTTLSPFGRVSPAEDENPGSATSTASLGKIEELPDDHPDSMSQYKEERDDFGGTGAHCSAPDFAKLLHALCPSPSNSNTTTPSPHRSSKTLDTTNAPSILSPALLAEMFTPQLSTSACTRLQSFFAIPEISHIFGHALPFARMRPDPHPATTTSPLPPLNFGLGGLLVLDDVPGSAPPDPLDIPGPRPQRFPPSGRRRRSGSMFWSALPNLFWWIDPASGVSGIYASQLLPQGDPQSLEWFARWEEVVYERVAAPGGC